MRELIFKVYLPCLILLALGIQIGQNWYRMHHEQPIVIHNYIPQCKDEPK